MAISKYSVLDRKEDSRVYRLSSVAGDIALDVLEAQNSQLGEIKPAVIEEAKQVVLLCFVFLSQVYRFGMVNITILS